MHQALTIDDDNTNADKTRPLIRQGTPWQ